MVYSNPSPFTLVALTLALLVSAKQTPCHSWQQQRVDELNQITTSDSQRASWGSGRFQRDSSTA